MMITFRGHASENLGLGSTLRQFAKACLATGRDVAIVDVDSGAGRHGFDTELKAHFVDEVDVVDDALCIHVFGADGMTEQAVEVCRDETLRRCFNAAFVWWELPDVPAYWKRSLTAFDAIVTGSEFVQSVFANSVDGVPVLLARQPLDVPQNIGADRARFGIPRDSFVVFTGFDLYSESARKNPVAGIQAFKRAFAADENACLVVKCSTAGLPPHLAQRVAELRHLIGDDPRIRLFEERLPFSDLLSLYASCDVALSLHRAEGLALMPLEFMRLGKPVVATGWSGNMTFMTHRDCGLVRYSFVPTDESCGHYRPSRIGVASRWADPDIDDAATWLKAFYDQPELRRTYGERALARSLEYDAQARKLEFLDELQAIARHRPRRSAQEFEVLGREIELLDHQEHRRRHRLTQTRAQRFMETANERYQRYVGWRFNAANRAG